MTQQQFFYPQSQHILQQLIDQRNPAKIQRVAFFGGADIEENEPVFREAYQAARLIAQQKKVIINGGGTGVMLAATKGAQSVKGQTIAISFRPNDMPQYSEETPENQADIRLEMDNYMNRMGGLIHLADLFIIFKGGTGTLSEWATTWLLAYLRLGHHQPLILYGSFWHEVIAVLDKHFLIGQLEHRVYTIVTQLEELMPTLQRLETEVARRH